MRWKSILSVAALVAAGLVAGASPALAADTGTITGHLTTDTGEPVSVASVNAYDVETWDLLGQAIVAEDGSYTIDGLPAGAYRLEFLAWDRPIQYFDNKSSISDADPVTVTAGQTTTVDEDLLPVGYITGVLTDAGGVPLTFRTVEINSVDGSQSEWASTDHEGRYRAAVLPGEYHVSFQPYDEGQQQFIPGTPFARDATAYTVAVGQEVEANDAALSPGSISGRLTTVDGQPVPNAGVFLSNRESDWIRLYPTTNANGVFRAPVVLPGQYIVRFEGDERLQYYNGKTSPDKANLITVTSGQDTRVNDSWLPTGSVTIAAIDAVTGAPIADFCANGTCSDGTGSLTVSGLVQGSNELYIFSDDGSYFSRSRTVNVRGGATVSITVKLRPTARITTTVVDAATGAPVGGVCAGAINVKEPRMPDGFGACSDEQGNLTLSYLEAGTYNLFVDPSSTPEYGRQWVGPAGGTGDQRLAAPITAVAGSLSTAPTVRLDPGGSIAGTVTDADTGAPLESTFIGLLTSHPGAGVSETNTDADGNYRVDRLGPYEWPLRYGTDGYAQQWSGNAATRYAATPVPVTAGGVANGDIALVRGVEVRGTVSIAHGATLNGFITTVNAETRDIAGAAWTEGGVYSMRVMPNQRVFYAYDLFNGDEHFSSDRAALPPAEPGGPVRYVVRVPASGLTLNLEVPIP